MFSIHGKLTKKLIQVGLRIRVTKQLIYKTSFHMIKISIQKNITPPFGKRFVGTTISSIIQNIVQPDT